MIPVGSGFLLVLKNVLLLCGFKTLQFFFTKAQRLLWNLNGTSGKILLSKKNENYDNCVQVLRIFFYYKFNYTNSISANDFLTIHERFENPRYVFENDHVTLLGISGEYAMFVEASRKEMELWRMEYAPFIRLAQVIFGRKLLLVPLEQFHRMAEELGDPKADIVFLFKTSRCGSTLLVQMMENTGQCMSISEPDSLNALWELYHKNHNGLKIRELARDLVRWTCRPHATWNPKLYFIKAYAPTFELLPVLAEVYPNARLLFMYRDIVKLSQSVTRLIQVLPALWMFVWLAKRLPYFREKFLEMMNFKSYPKKDKIRINDFSCGLFLFIQCCKYYINFRQQGFSINAIRYEDILTDRISSGKAILKYCGLSEAYLKKFLTGLENDSQRNSPFSRAYLKNFPTSRFDEDTLREANDLLGDFGLPLIGEDCLIEGTITNYK